LLLLAACATPTAFEADQRQAVDAFVATACRLYGLGSIPVVIGDIPGAGGEWGNGTISLNRGMLTDWRRDALLAHELGHAVLGHRSFATSSFESPATMGEWARLTVPRELDANAKAVEILARVKGWPVGRALQFMADFLGAAYEAQRRGQPIPVGHPAARQARRGVLL